MARSAELYPLELTHASSILAVMGDAVALRTLLLLREEPKRFSELQAALPKTSSKTLSAKLKLLEAHELLTRTLFAEVPPRAVYALTEKGRELTALVGRVLTWERSWQRG